MCLCVCIAIIIKRDYEFEKGLKYRNKRVAEIRNRSECDINTGFIYEIIKIYLNKNFQLSMRELIQRLLE